MPPLTNLPPSPISPSDAELLLSDELTLQSSIKKIEGESLPTPNSTPIKLPPIKLTMKLIRTSNLSSTETNNLSNDDLADYLLSKTTLHLSYLNLSSTSLDTIHAFNYLTELYLNGNSIDDLDDSLDFCTSLRILFLSYNKIASLPCLLHLKSLQVLDVSNNLIPTQPAYDKVFPKTLRILDLSHNPFSVSVPIDLSTFPFLTNYNNRKTLSPPSSAPKMLSITLPLDNDDGTPNATSELPFKANDDLWVIADVFCKRYDIIGDGSRREIVKLMKVECVEVGIEIVDGKVTRVKMEETKGMGDSDSDGDDGRYKESIQTNTNKTITAIDEFLSEVSPQPKYKAQITQITSNIESRKNEGEEVSSNAMDEARLKLQERMTRLKLERKQEKEKSSMREKDALIHNDLIRKDTRMDIEIMTERRGKILGQEEWDDLNDGEALGYRSKSYTRSESKYNDDDDDDFDDDDDGEEGKHEYYGEGKYDFNDFNENDVEGMRNDIDEMELDIKDFEQRLNIGVKVILPSTTTNVKANGNGNAGVIKDKKKVVKRFGNSNSEGKENQGRISRK